MKWSSSLSGLLLCLFTCMAAETLAAEPDYFEYHLSIEKAEGFIADESYAQALTVYREVFENFDFVFLRDYKVASQLAYYLDSLSTGVDLVKKGIAAGWKLKEIKRNVFLASKMSKADWSEIKSAEDSLKSIYFDRINEEVGAKVHDLFKKDQKKAMGSMVRIRGASQVSFGVKKFAPHSEEQMRQAIIIFEAYGYPGEKLIGNDYWMSTIISHHVSISPEYSEKDTLYKHIFPMLINALSKGEVSPYECALVDDWYRSVRWDRTKPAYGFLDPPTSATLDETNALRQSVSLRTIELRNSLVEIESKTGMDFYLPDWVKGKIRVIE